MANREGLASDSQGCARADSSRASGPNGPWNLDVYPEQLAVPE